MREGGGEREKGRISVRERCQEEVGFESRAERGGRGGVADGVREIVPDRGSLVGEGALTIRLSSNYRECENSGVGGGAKRSGRSVGME